MARDHVRLLVEPYRSDRTDYGQLTAAFAALHALLGTRRTLALEVHLDRRAEGSPLAWFAAVCPAGLERAVEAVLRRAYPNVRLREVRGPADGRLRGVRLVRRSPPRGEDEVPAEGEGAEALLRAMAAAGPPATLRLVLRPAPGLVERLFPAEMQPVGPLLWGEAQVLAPDVVRARAIASVLVAGPPRLMASRIRGAAELRRSPRRLFRPSELARLWSLPAPEFAGVPYVRRSVPLAPAPPGVPRARDEDGLVRDEHGSVTIPEAMRRQHVAVIGAVDQGKTSFLVASTRADLVRADCALIVLDPKGDAADAVLSVVPRERRCTLLDMAAPTAGFNPLAVDGAPDAIADHVVAALRGLFADGEVRGSSDRYLRNALIAVLACARDATLWDVARLLEVGDAGRSLRARVAERLETMPAYAELAVFLAEELPTQLADARASTTANRVVLVGNLTRDPELRTSTSGTSICRLRVACNAVRRNRDTGEVDERPNFFDVTVFGASGDACARFLSKGRPVAVDGRLEWSEWQTAEGETRQAVGIIAESLQFLGARPDADADAVEAEQEEVVAF